MRTSRVDHRIDYIMVIRRTTGPDFDTQTPQPVGEPDTIG
jgi:hypothetical protein